MTMGAIVGAIVGIEIVAVEGEQAALMKTSINPIMRTVLIEFLLSDWSCQPYSIPVVRFHRSEGLSLNGF
jgi:hypothetical protein